MFGCPAARGFLCWWVCSLFFGVAVPVCLTCFNRVLILALENPVGR